MSKLHDKTGEVKWHLKIIFIYYSSYGDKNSYKFLKLQNYRRFLIDSQCVKEQTQFPQFDIAFRKVSHSTVSYQQFLQLIPNLAQIVFPKIIRSSSFQKFMKNNIQSLYSEILTHSEFGQDLKVTFNCEIQTKTLRFLDNNIPLKRGFHQYIQSTSMHQRDVDQTFEKVYLYLKDFQICPFFAYKSLCYVMYHTIIKDKQANHRFEIEDFKILLIVISQVFFTKQSYSDLCQRAKILKLLQKMEISNGFQKMVTKYQQQHCQTISFLTNFRTYQEDEDHCMNVFNQSIGKVFPSSTRHKNCLNYFSSTSKKVSRKQNNETVRKMLQEETSQHTLQDLHQIKKVFSELCSYGEVANIKTLKSIKIKKIYESMDVLKNLTQIWLDLTITQLCRGSPSGKIQFSQFIQLLHLSAKKLKTTKQKFTEYFLTYYQKQNKKIPNQTSKKFHQDDKLLNSMIHLIEKPLLRIYMYYSKSKKQMSFDSLTKMMYDFQLFPSIVSKNRLHQLFEQQVEGNKDQTQFNKLVKDNLINFQGFQNIIKAVSQQIGGDEQMNQQQKLIIIIEKMHQSNGHKVILLGKGINLVTQLRNKFSSIYKKNFDHTQKKVKKVENFNELMVDYQ